MAEYHDIILCIYAFFNSACIDFIHLADSRSFFVRFAAIIDTNCITIAIVYGRYGLRTQYEQYVRGA